MPLHEHRPSNILDLAYNIFAFDGSDFALTDDIMPPFRQRQNQIQRNTKETLLHHMVNLKSLTFRGYAWPEEVPPSALLFTITYLPSLTTLIIIEDYRYYYPLPSYSTQIGSVLSRRPLPERLQLESGGWDLERHILQSDVPRLSHLMPQPHRAKVMVYEGCVTSLLIRSRLALPSPYGRNLWKLLATPEAPVTTLTLDTLEPKDLRSILGLVSQHIRDVQTLFIEGVLFEELNSVCRRGDTSRISKAGAIGTDDFVFVS
ncbi:hypothetical protein FRB94_005104 [Tulasnella sp. JGI-2019a]|nr:hypothetical protein FRB94_005104 [Tulasnella sp. JGI-2019a]KAG9008720.1 hypothetical protein FRB93_006266 [Tulasnella sp. JGI-2019a]